MIRDPDFNAKAQGPKAQSARSFAALESLRLFVDYGWLGPGQSWGIVQNRGKSCLATRVDGRQRALLFQHPRFELPNSRFCRHLHSNGGGICCTPLHPVALKMEASLRGESGSGGARNQERPG